MFGTSDWFSSFIRAMQISDSNLLGIKKKTRCEMSCIYMLKKTLKIGNVRIQNIWSNLEENMDSEIICFF